MSVAFQETLRHLQPPMEADAFLDWVEEGVRAELINGAVFMHSPVALNHADLVNFLSRFLALHVESKDLGRVYTDVVAVKLGYRKVFMPDVFWVERARLEQVETNVVPFAPKFVIEVLSLSTSANDTGPKFTAYEESGVEDYWVIDPTDAETVFYQREGELLVPQAMPRDWVAAASVPGFRVRRDWLRPGKMPGVGEALAMMA